MKKLNLPKIGYPYIRWHNKIVCGKKNAQVKNNLESIRRNVGVQYKNFFRGVVNDDLESIAKINWIIDKKNDLHSCYKNKSLVLSGLFSQIKQAQPSGTFSKCPYCGITRPSSHDHYLPFDLYPEFSVHGLNLIPCCAECNSSKGKKWLRNSVRRFIYFYLDDIPDDQFLYAEIFSRDGAFSAKFELRKPKAASSRVWGIIESHFEGLSLLKRYEQESSDEISNVFDICKAYLIVGGHSIQDLLIQLSSSEAKKFGNNHWRVALMRALTMAGEFCDEVEGRCEE